MGSGRFDSHAYAGYTTATAGMSRDARFATRELKSDSRLNPKGVKMRESRDSADNPASTAIIVALDVTGSMGMVAEAIAKEGLGPLFTRLYAERPVTDPHIMFMGVGDAYFDSAPLQVSQFEADNRIVEQLTELYLEGGGGGNRFESYHLPWYFAARKTSIDCWDKRGKKGYLFTVGDEEAPAPLRAEQISRILGDSEQRDYTAKELLEEAQRRYHVFHIIVEEGNHARTYLPQVQSSWRDLLGQRALSLKDYTKLGDGIVSIIQMNEDQLGHGASTRPTATLPGYVELLPAT